MDVFSTHGLAVDVVDDGRQGRSGSPSTSAVGNLHRTGPAYLMNMPPLISMVSRPGTPRRRREERDDVGDVFRVPARPRGMVLTVAANASGGVKVLWNGVPPMRLATPRSQADAVRREFLRVGLREREHGGLGRGVQPRRRGRRRCDAASDVRLTMAPWPRANHAARPWQHQERGERVDVHDVVEERLAHLREAVRPSQPAAFVDEDVMRRSATARPRRCASRRRSS